MRDVSSPIAGSYVSYNGGPGGTTARPTAAQAAALHERHSPATAVQIRHRRAASANREFLASVNHGKPPVAATSSPGEFTGKNVVPACGAATGNSVAHTRAVPSHSGKSKATAEKAALARAKESAVTEKRAPATQPSEKATTERSSAAHTSRNTETDKHAAATHPSESKATTEKAAATYPSRNTETEKHAAATHPTESKATTESASWRGGYEHEIGDFPQLATKTSS